MAASQRMGFVRASVVGLFAWAAGCATVPLPVGFVEHDAPVGEKKAVAADESLFWFRAFSDPARGSLGFWREALQRELVEDRGYTLVEERETEMRGLPAVEYRFEATVGGVVRGYLLCVAVEEGWWRNRILTAEYVADRDRFETHLSSVRDALGVRPP